MKKNFFSLPTLVLFPFLGMLAASIVYTFSIQGLNPTTFITIRLFIVTFTLVIFFSIGLNATTITLLRSFLITALYSGLFYISQTAIERSQLFYYGYFAFLYYASFYIAFCFHQAYLQRAPTQCFSKTLREVAWNTLIILIITFLFTLIGELILISSSDLLKQWGFSSLYDFLTQRLTISLCVGIFIGAGIATCRKYLALIMAIRQLFFQLCRFFLPLLAVFGFVLAFLLLKSHTALQVVNDAPTLTGLTLIALATTNAVHALAENHLPYPRWLSYFVSAFLVILPVLPGTLLFATCFSLPIHSALFFELRVFNGLLFIYSVTYLVNIFLSQKNKWLPFLDVSNQWLAIITLLAGIAVSLMQ